MKVVILAGGFGTRISEESVLKPKPMVEIGDKPILWHIMKLYSHYGYNEFVICCGYKQHMIKEWFTVKPPYLPYGKKRKLSLSSFKNDLFILHLCRNCLFWQLPSQCFQLFQVCMDLPLCIKLIVVFCPKILIFHTVFQDMINRY